MSWETANDRRPPRDVAVPFGPVFDRVVVDLPCSGTGALREQRVVSAGEDRRPSTATRASVSAGEADGRRIGVFPGSFDPVHNGHLDLIERARRLFDVLYIAVLYNEQKQALFSVRERIDLLRDLLGDSDDCRIESFSGLLVDYVRERSATAVVRGLRSGADFDYELPMTLMNRRLAPGIDTIFLLPAPEWIFLSSRLTKEVGSLEGDLTGVVPPPVVEALRRKLG